MINKEIVKTEQAIRRIVSRHKKDIDWFTKNVTPNRIERQRIGVSDLWESYCKSVITSQQRITDNFHADLMNDRFVGGVFRNERTNRPNVDTLAEKFSNFNVRFPENKARFISNAWDRDWKKMVSDINKIMQSRRKNQKSSDQKREEELKLARMLQMELRGCGVGPKISRLILRWVINEWYSPFCNTIPLDSRWKNAIDNEGIQVDNVRFSSERSYTEFEDILCKVAYDCQYSPMLIDYAVFGIIRREREREEYEYKKSS